VEQYASMQAAAARCSVSSCENVQREISIERRVSRYLARGLCCVLIACTVALARSQESSTAENTLEGTVVSSTRETLVVRTGDNEFQLFVFDRYTTKPRSLPVGTRVRVLSAPAEEAGRRIARSVTVLEPAAKEQAARRGQADSTRGSGRRARNKEGSAPLASRRTCRCWA
jgi:RNase P/RNase MRP subunit p29